PPAPMGSPSPLPPSPPEPPSPSHMALATPDPPPWTSLAKPSRNPGQDLAPHHGPRSCPESRPAAAPPQLPRLWEELQLEVPCSICIKFLEVPVTLDCGHNYCQACILQYWDRVEEEEEDPKQCPQCRRAFRQRSFRRNKLLAHVVAILERSRVSTPSEAAPPGQQPTVCTAASSPLPAGCAAEDLPEAAGDGGDRPKQGWSQSPRAAAVAGGAGRRRGFPSSCSDTGRPERGRGRGGRGGWLLGLTRERWNLKPVLSHSISGLPSHPAPICLLFCPTPLLLAVHSRGLTWAPIHCGAGLESSTEPGRVAVPREETQPRSDSRKPSEARSQTPEPCNCWLPWPSSIQQIQMNHYRVMFPSLHWSDLISFPSPDLHTLSNLTPYTPFPVEVTLDPKTANPKLILSSDRRSMQLGDEQKDLPSTCERFDTDPCVLASEGFSSGQYYWEVEVGDAGGWAVGVASKSVKRKGPLYLKPEHGFWTVELHMGKYWALGTCLARVHSSKRLRRVGIYLDCTEGQVAFYNADAFAHLYTFTASFTEEIFPFFYL
uniref:Uncharacterized protein n=1 Tax=Pelodiscus sinensis TaxID=13735 RepID=K7F3L6_PELSI